ncbi:MAG: hypothetical protein GWP91_08060 [Rhodobacterales bacterium]|nr:hypothetical protein [Rhodobacterales bacterium]
MCPCAPLSLFLIARLAWADPLEKPPAEVPPESELPSALDGLLTSDEPGQRIIRNEEGPSETTGAWYVWPMSLSSFYPHPNADEKNFRSEYLGANVGRRWYSIGGSLGYSLDVGTSALFPLGPRTRGRMLKTYVLGGPRTRYFSVMVGPLLASNELHLDGAGGLSLASFWGASAQIMSDLGPVTLMVGAEPVWKLGGERNGADWATLQLPGFADELVYTAGVSMSVHKFWRIQVGERLWLSEIGPYRSVFLGVSIQ